MITVLVVDDSRLARQVAAGILSRARPDWILLQASHAAEALALIQEHDIQIALIDFNMPGDDGFSLANIARTKLRPGHRDRLGEYPGLACRARARDGRDLPGKPLTEEALGRFLGGAALRSKRLAAERSRTGSAG